MRQRMFVFVCVCLPSQPPRMQPDTRACVCFGWKIRESRCRASNHTRLGKLTDDAAVDDDDAANARVLTQYNAYTYTIVCAH